MLFLTRWFGVTASDTQRGRDREQSYIDEIVEKILVMQANAAARQHRRLGRGTHVKGVCARAQFEVLDITGGRECELARRLAQGMFARPGIYPALVRFANSNSAVSSDFMPDGRSLSFSVELGGGGTAAGCEHGGRQDFSLQNAPTMPINDARAFRAAMHLLTASNPAAGLWRLPLSDKLRVLRSLALGLPQACQKVKPYQRLRYWSTVPFRHGPSDIVKHSATPSPDNPARPLQRSNPNALQDELLRHLQEDRQMSSFDFALQLLDTERMSYWGKRRDTDFWVENASVKWKEAQAPYHTVARLTLLPNSQLAPDTGEATHFDVTRHSTADSTPLGSINRARGSGEAASRNARLHEHATRP
jgi:hypothetical protein